MFESSHLPADGGAPEGGRTDSPAIALSLDNVPLDLPVAGAGSRVLASFIDHILLMVVLFVAGVAGTLAAAAFKLEGGWLAVTVVVVMFLVQWAVWATVEIATKGRTPGKAAVKIRVVTRFGGQPSAAAFLVRNLTRLVDYIVGVPMMAIDPMARRIGDHLAGTLVVHDRQAAAESAARRLPRGWGASEAALVEAFVARYREMEPERAAGMARRLLAAAERAEPGFCAARTESEDLEEAVRRSFAVEGR